MFPIARDPLVTSGVLLLALLFEGSNAGAQTLLEQATARPSIGCATCFPKPPGIADAFDADELEAAFKDGAPVVLAHDTELAHDSYEKAFVIEERFPLYGALSRSEISKIQLDTALAGRRQRLPESGPLRVYAAGTPIEQRKLRNVLRNLDGTRGLRSIPLFISRDEDLQSARSSAEALILVFHAADLSGFKRLPIDGLHVAALGSEVAYALKSSVNVYRRRDAEGAKALEALLGMLDRR